MRCVSVESVDTDSDLYDLEIDGGNNNYVADGVVVHNTFCAIVFEPGLNHPEMFGEHGEIIVHSKGLGSQGLAFKNNTANDGNLYGRTLRALLDAGFEDQLKELQDLTQFKKIALVGEITNLENIIAGKRMLLDSLIDGSSSSTELTREYVRINISELSRILDDLKQINT